MTKVLFNISQDTIYGVQGVDTLVTAKAATRRVSGDILVTRNQLRESDSRPFTLDLAPTGLGQAWIITVSPDNGDSFSGYYKVPAGDTVSFTNLIEVDPNTLEAADTPDPEWWAVANSTVNSGKVVNDHLILTRNDGVEVDAGNVRGLPGQDGADGADGAPGRDGVNGAPGADGVSVVYTEIDANGDLLVTLSNDQVVNAGRARGIDGVDGVDGVDGAVRMLSTFGAIGDGVADDTVSINAALSHSLATGEPVIVDSAFTELSVMGVITVPEGVCFDGNHVPIAWKTPQGTHMFSMSNNSSLKNIRATADTSINNNQRGISVYQKSGVTIENVSIIGTTAGTGAGNQYRTALTVDGSTDVRITGLVVENFDFPVTVSGSTRVTMDGVDIKTYQRGLYLNDAKDISVRDARIQGLSPNASATAGHNGVLIGGSDHYLTSNILLDNVFVYDSGEHGFRIGGNKIVSVVEFRSCKSINAGRCGFKVLGGEIADNNYHEDIDFNNCKVVDGGNVEINAAGFMVQFVKRVNIVNPVVIKKNKTYSAGIGIEAQAVDGLQIINPYIHSTLKSGILFSHVLGDLTEITINGGYIFSGTGNGLTINYGQRTVRRFRMNGYPEINLGGSGYAVSITNTTGTVTGRSFISFYSLTPSAQLLDPAMNSGGFACDIRATFPATSIDSYFTNGSVWWDVAATVAEPRFKVSGAWKKLSYAV